VLLLDTDILIDIQRGHAPALTWFSSLPELSFVPGFVVMELVNVKHYRVVPGLQTLQPYAR
jgi:predicted nucleic acid-binding protein